MRSILYFAYGSNIDKHQMKQRCPEAVFVGGAVLPNHRFVLDQRGAANVVPSAKRSVHGILWCLSESDEHALDRYEGVASGIYKKTHLAVLRLDEQASTEALLYIGRSDGQGAPRSTEYMSRILAAATEHGFPAPYIAELREWLATSS